MSGLGEHLGNRPWGHREDPVVTEDTPPSVDKHVEQHVQNLTTAHWLTTGKPHWLRVSNGNAKRQQDRVIAQNLYA